MNYLYNSSSRIILCLIFLFTTCSLAAQTGINTRSPHASTVLQIDSPDKGVLFPRIALQNKTDQVTITNPITGLVVLNTNRVDVADNPGASLQANSYYYWNGSEWTLFVEHSLFLNQLDIYKVPRLEALINFRAQPAGSIQTAFLSPVISATESINIRQILFDEASVDPNNTFDLNSSIFTAARPGYYAFDLNMLIRTYGADDINNFYTVGISRPFVDFNRPPNAVVAGIAINDGSSAWSNASFAFIHRFRSTATVATVTVPTTMTVKGIQRMEAGEKVIFLTRFITPATNTSSPARYSNDVESLNYSRNITNTVTITYYPID